MKKTLLVLVSILMLVSSFGGLQVAAEKGQSERYVLIDGVIEDTYEGTYIPQYFTLDSNGEYVELDLEEAVVKLNEMEKSYAMVQEILQNIESNNSQVEFGFNNIISSSIIPTYEYIESNAYSYYGNERKLTNTLKCPDVAGATSCAKSLSYSLSESESFSVEGGVEFFGFIRAGASFTWHSSASVTSTDTVTIQPGYEVYMAGRPRMNFTVGRLHVYVNGQSVGDTYAAGSSPYKLSTGLLDADIYPIIKPI